VAKRKRAIPYLFVACFFLLGLVGILNHAMWRDELNVWLIVRHSPSLIELFRNIKYEGHPGLWYLCLYGISHFTDNPIAMQIFHLLLATGFTYLFMRFSPFTYLQKILFSLGYLPVYEYLLISRNYAIEILFLFGFCALFPDRQKGYLRLSLLLFLLANTNAYGLLIALSLGITLILEYSLNRRKLTIPISNLCLSLGLFSLGIFTSLVQLIPPTDSTLAGGAEGWTLRFDFLHFLTALTRIWSSYIVILVPRDASQIEMALFSILSLGLLTFSGLLLIRKPIALFFYLLSTLIIFLLTYAKFLGAARHYGHLYIVLIVAFWLASYYPESTQLTQLINQLPRSINSIVLGWVRVADRHKRAFFMIILCAQFAGGIVAFGRDLSVPFSASKATAAFIRTSHLEKLFMIGSRDYAVSPLCGYLNREIYYPERRGLGSFVLFNSQRQEVDIASVLAQTSQIVQQQPGNVLLILNTELEAPKQNLQISALAKFTNSFIGEERYYLYLVSKPDPIAPL